MSPYLEQIHAVLPRVLGAMDVDRTSPTHGVADRYHWAWKLIDFPNGTFQGAAHGLARLVAAELLPAGIDPASIVARVRGLLDAMPRIARGDGSLEEAFPYESSFCVTALALYDACSALDVLRDHLDDTARRQHLDALRPLRAFLEHADEDHAVITNHVAVAAAACIRWHALTGEASSRGAALLERVRAAQSEEGWFTEYGGADPGYQTFTTAFLADLHRLDPALGLGEALARSCAFLAYAAHPDGAFGGPIGSRRTRFCVPSGVELLADDDPNAAALAAHVRRAIAVQRTPGLTGFDDANLVPFFNPWCRAAEIVAARETADEPAGTVLPAERDSVRVVLPDAGWIVRGDAARYTVISAAHGGSYVTTPRDGLSEADGGPLAIDRTGRFHAAQYDAAAVTATMNDAATLTLTYPLRRVEKAVPTAFRFIVLRSLALTVMRVPAVRGMIKRALVRLLINRVPSATAQVSRTFTFEPAFAVRDAIESVAHAPEPLVLEAPPVRHAVIHMASMGYWQLQDDAP